MRVLLLLLVLLVSTSTWAQDVSIFNQEPSRTNCERLGMFLYDNEPDNPFDAVRMLYSARIGYIGITPKGVDIMVSSCDADLGYTDELMRSKVLNNMDVIMEPVVGYVLTYRYAKDRYYRAIARLDDEADALANQLDGLEHYGDMSGIVNHLIRRNYEVMEIRQKYIDYLIILEEDYREVIRDYREQYDWLYTMY